MIASMDLCTVTLKLSKSDQQQRPTEIHNKQLCKSCDMFEDKCVWSALYPISNHSHIRQLQFATHAFSQQVLQQAVQISICQCSQLVKKSSTNLVPGFGCKDI